MPDKVHSSQYPLCIHIHIMHLKELYAIEILLVNMLPKQRKTTLDQLSPQPGLFSHGSPHCNQSFQWMVHMLVWIAPPILKDKLPSHENHAHPGTALNWPHPIGREPPFSGRRLTSCTNHDDRSCQEQPDTHSGGYSTASVCTEAKKEFTKVPVRKMSSAQIFTEPAHRWLQLHG